MHRSASYALRMIDGLLPPLFDDISDKDLSKMSSDTGELVSQINQLREKQLHGGGLTDDEVRVGIRLLNDLRIARAAKSSKAESVNAGISLKELF